MNIRRTVMSTIAVLLVSAATAVSPAYAAPVRYEAEDGVVNPGTIDSDHTGYSGTGFANTGNVTGASVEWTVTASQTGNAALSIGYANGTSTNRPADITVNGTLTADEFAFPATGSWSTWQTRTLQANLTAGSNTIRVTATTGSGLPNIDYLDVDLGTTEPPQETLLSQGKPATSSSAENTTLTPDKAVDGDTATRWASAEGSDPQWLAIDLQTTATITRVNLNWEAAHASAYRIETSTNGTTWTTIYSTTSGDGGTDDITGLNATARHVRVYGTQRATQWGYSLWETSIYGTTDGDDPPPPDGDTPVERNGQLHVCGTKLCNQDNQPIQLRGMSTHGTQWYPQCVNTASMDALADDWEADVIRISTYVQEDGYETDPELFTQRAHDFIDMATARGMYVIVDWHMLTPGDPNYNLSRARTFFTEIAQVHGDQPNILYEVANEPNGVSWSSIKSYHEQIIPTIRGIDANSVILLGTRAWSSLGVSDGADETEVVNNPVNASNIMYTFHFYAASHLDDYLNALDRASDVLPMFVTEFGTQNYAGEGANDFANSQRYLDLMESKQIGWTNWNYSDDNRSGAVFQTGTCPGGPFAGTGSLKEAGVWIRARIKEGTA